MSKLIAILCVFNTFFLFSQQNTSINTIYLDVDTPALYVEGTTALQRHIISCSQELKNFFKPGTFLLISFIVEQDGTITQVSAVNTQLPEEAQVIINKMFSSMGPWKPAVVNGKKVRSKNFITLEL
ncbi:MAG: hypothetical protein N2Z72_07365 [Bacteroidales bacterium]|nr:hypothetical protein [Bacteroidales bacterium]